MSQKKWHHKRVKVPTVLQMEAVECGAACLSMIMTYFGRIEPLEKVRMACGVSRDGSKVGNILKAARQYGFDAHAYKKEPNTLATLPLPMIIYWNFNHFVVFEGMKGHRIFINDPGFGPKIVTEKEFDQSFTGLVLTCQPGPEFKKGGTKQGFLKPLLKRLSGNMTALSYLILAGFFLVFPGFILPLFSKVFIDNILIARMDDWLKPLVIGMMLTALFRAILSILQKQYLLRLEIKLSILLSSQFLHHIFRLPLDFFTQRYCGEIGNRVKLNDQIAQLLSRDLVANMINCVMVCFFLVVMIQYDSELTLSVGLIAILNLFVLRSVSRKRIDLTQRLLQEKGKLTGTLMNGMQIIETLKASGAESELFNRLIGYNARVINAEQELNHTTQILSVIPLFLTMINSILILLLGGLRTMDGDFTIGSLVAFQSLSASFMAPVNQLVNMGSKLQELKGCMNRIDDVLRYSKDPMEVCETLPLPNQTNLDTMDQLRPKDSEKIISTHSHAQIRLRGQIDLQDISFGYNQLEPPLINNFSLSLQPGARIALIGGSGSGKSTIAKLMVGLYQPQKGTILFDHIPLTQMNRHIFTHSIAFVDQDITLFEGTIRDNITMWDDSISEQQMIQAAKDACIHDDIMQRPGGYDSLVHEFGSNFSGGQKQRLEIARSLVINPGILVLDEATSALDTYTEKMIDDHIRRRGCTCIIVAHRLSSIRDCDEIIVLENGHVMERGTHSDLMDLNGIYEKLIKES